ncbi:hypothetical protein BN1058_02777 [Paraliobacillus sp. PM-2]|uniref:hypothetical protein n=1 Tax=Paraliobacillus sp. PM-2 TaxID=1462524 RepID=UPI00061BB43E|nr:hypothetical protein [Paraliobacillus sp. PM-2]CQR48408.1 hypothetical protein BN1058_02777 [Paraliobacillus sp. PM-2]
MHAFTGSKEELLWKVVRAEMHSEHHLARAIVEETKYTFGTSISPGEDFTVLPGRGITAIVDNEKLLIGTRLMDEYGFSFFSRSERSITKHRE